VVSVREVSVRVICGARGQEAIDVSGADGFLRGLSVWDLREEGFGARENIPAGDQYHSRCNFWVVSGEPVIQRSAGLGGHQQVTEDEIEAMIGLQ